MECNYCGTEYTRSNFCPTCGKCRPGALRNVKIMGFTGPASLSPTVEKFWHTGDPDDL